MDDKKKKEDAANAEKGTVGSTLGGAVAGAVAGTALRVPVVGTVIGALSGAAIGAARKRTRKPRRRKAKGAVAAPKKSFQKESAHDKEVVQKGKIKENNGRAATTRTAPKRATTKKPQLG